MVLTLKQLNLVLYNYGLHVVSVQLYKLRLSQLACPPPLTNKWIINPSQLQSKNIEKSTKKLVISFSHIRHVIGKVR